MADGRCPFSEVIEYMFDKNFRVRPRNQDAFVHGKRQSHELAFADDVVHRPPPRPLRQRLAVPLLGVARDGALPLRIQPGAVDAQDVA